MFNTLPSRVRPTRVSVSTHYQRILHESFNKFRFLNSNFRILYAAFLLQFSFVLPLSVAISSDERKYGVYLEGYLVFLNCTAIPALFVLHYVLWRVNKVSVHRWLYEKVLQAYRARKRRKSQTSQQNANRKRSAGASSVGEQQNDKSQLAETESPDAHVDFQEDDSTPTASAAAGAEEANGEKIKTRPSLQFFIGEGAITNGDSHGHGHGHDVHLRFEDTGRSAAEEMESALGNVAPAESPQPDGTNTDNYQPDQNGQNANGNLDHLTEPVSGPDIMMRIGAFAFGMAGMVLNILRMCDRWLNPTYYENCRTSLSMATYIFHILFYFVQTYFLFKHQGHRFPRSNRIVRFLLMHMVVANIAMWINAVVMEVTEDLHEKTYEDLGEHTLANNDSFEAAMFLLKEGRIFLNHVISGEDSKTRQKFILYYCHAQEVLSLSADTYLFPLMIEYFIISASVMCKIYMSSYTFDRPHRSEPKLKRSKSGKKWIRSFSERRMSSLRGRSGIIDDMEVIDDGYHDDSETCCCSCEKSYAGLVFGLILMVIAVASVAAFLVVLQLKKIDEEILIQSELTALNKREAAARNFSMSMASNFSLQDVPPNNYSSAFSLKFFFGNHLLADSHKEHEHEVEEIQARIASSTMIALMIYQCAELVLVIPPLIACILGFFKFRAHFVFRAPHHSERIDAQMLFIGFLGIMIYSTFVVIASLERISEAAIYQVVTWAMKTFLSMVQSLLQICFIMRGFRSMLPPDNTELLERKPGRSLVTLLILSNLSLWLSNTFQLKYVDQIPDLYHSHSNVTPWSIVTHLLIPFVIFFRFHSTISLLHIWHVDYAVHENLEMTYLSYENRPVKGGRLRK